MISKPEFLTDEVKPFEECVYILKTDGRLGVLIPFDSEPMLEAINLLNDFYLQPFQPEMITGYFKGVSKPEGDTYFLLRGGGWVRFSENEVHYSQIASEKSKRRMWVMLYPKTLQQFISNCNQADIKLEWK